MEEEELVGIVRRFAESGWDLISIPAQRYLNGEDCNDTLIKAVRAADAECGSCGCEYDALYKRFLELQDAL